VLTVANYFAGFSFATIQGQRLTPLLLTLFFISLFFSAEGFNFQWRFRKWLALFPLLFFFIVIFPQSQPDLIAWNQGSHRYLYFPREHLAIGDGNPSHWQELISVLEKDKVREIRILPFPGALSAGDVNRLFHQLEDIGVRAYFLPEDCWKKGANCWKDEGRTAYSYVEPKSYSGLSADNWLTFNVRERHWVRLYRSSSETLVIFTPFLTVCVSEEGTILSVCRGDVQFLRSHSLLFIHQKIPYLMDRVIDIYGNEDKSKIQVVKRKEPGAGF